MAFLLSATPPLPFVVKSFFVVGTVCMFVGWSLFFRMLIELNRRTPAEKRFQLFEYRMHIREIQERHEVLFPVSRLRAGWLLLTAAGAVAMAIGILLAIRPR